MPVDKSILGLRFGSNAEVQPVRQELESFLAGPKKAGSRERHGDDLAVYVAMLGRIEAFAQRRRLDPASPGYRDKMFFGVLGVSSFFNPSLKTAIEQYKYHLHTLRSLDFHKPKAFIRSAEQEIAGLSPKKANDAAKINRLQGMIEQREHELAKLASQRIALREELRDIARYIRDNLTKIRKLCEGSIVVLVDFQIAGKEAHRLINDIHAEFQARLGESLLGGADDPAVTQEVAALSQELSALMREDVYALTGLFEAIHDHAKKISGLIDALLPRITAADGNDDLAPFEELEQVLVALISDFRFDLKIAALGAEMRHAGLLREEREEMLDRLLDLLQKERRTRGDRRVAERRTAKVAVTVERRGKQRRSGKSRR